MRCRPRHRLLLILPVRRAHYTPAVARAARHGAEFVQKELDAVQAWCSLRDLAVGLSADGGIWWGPAGLAHRECDDWQPRGGACAWVAVIAFRLLRTWHCCGGCAGKGMKMKAVTLRLAALEDRADTPRSAVRLRYLKGALDGTPNGPSAIPP